MKSKKIYVPGSNGETIFFANSEKALAFFPVEKGGKGSFVLTDNGRKIILNGARINGVSPARYAAEQGMVLAEGGNEAANRLADMLDIAEATQMVERISRERATELQKELGGQTYLYVPFEDGKTAELAAIRPYEGIGGYVVDSSGFTSGKVDVEFGSQLGSCVQMHKGWLVDQSISPASLPRVSAFGGLIEHAIFTMCNCGMGEIEGSAHVVMNEQASSDPVFARGKVSMRLKNGDLLTAGAGALDELRVTYERNGAVVYQRSGVVCGSQNPNLGTYIGAIAAVIVRVNEMDAYKPSKSRAKKAA